MSKTINAGRVTFVPKDNFSNNISYKKFDIVTYNGSSYFAKKDTIGHTPTEEEFWQLVAEKGQNGEPGAVKMQVVDTLPETGQTDTIYLVKKDNPGEQNLYDEYVYTDTGWEHIGDTSVDLSDYYTKEETDNKIFESIPILYNSTSPNNSSHSEFDLNEASRVITTLYKTGGRFFIYHNTRFDVPDVLIAIPSKITQITRQFGYGCYNSTGNSFGISVKGLNCTMEGKWNNDTFACRYVQFTFSKQSLVPATNTITSTSTAPVQGNVIKKYVDDNIKTYTAGENITISEDNVISSSIGLPVLENQEININTFPVGAYIITGKDTVIKYGTNGRSSYKPITTNSSTGNTDSWILNITHGSGSESDSGFAFLFRRAGSSGAAAFYTFDFSGMKSLDINMIMQSNTNQSIYGRFDFYHVLPTSSLVPSKDTELTNKKYVDDSPTTYTGYDATKTQVLKNINGTLTWVNE